MSSSELLAPAPLPPLASGQLAARDASTGSVVTVRDAAGLVALRDEWTELFAADPSASLFLTWEWLATWWRHLGGGLRLAVVLVRKGSRLAALAPLAANGRLGATGLRFLGTGAVGSDYLDLVVRAEERETALDALVDWFDRQRRPLDFAQLPSAGAHATELARRLEARGWRAVETAVQRCPYVGLAGRSWNDYLESRGPRHRANLRRRLRQLERRFDVSFRAAATNREADADLAILVDLHARRWSGRGGSDGLSDPAVIGFHRAFCRLAIERGWLRLYVLRLDGRPAAALYGLLHRGRFYFYQSGFDPRFAPHAVGLVTMGLTIRAAIEEGASEFDLLHGAEPYKFLWADRTRLLERRELFPPTPLGRARRWLTTSTRQARHALPPWLSRARAPWEPWA